MLSTCGLNPSRQQSTTQLPAYLSGCGWIREEERNSKSKKTCRLREEKGNKTSDAMAITTSHGQTDNQTVLKQKMPHLPFLHLSLFYFEARHMECIVSFSSLFRSCWLCSLPASCTPSCLLIEWGKSEKQRRPEQCAFFSNSENRCYWLCFSHKYKAQNHVTCYEEN